MNKSKDFKITTTQDDIITANYGIYAYYRVSDGEIIYIGKDSNIRQNRRHLDHIAPSKVKEQRINNYLNAKDIEKDIAYKVLALLPTEDEMNIAEIFYTMFYRALGQCKLNELLEITPEAYDTIVDGIGDLGLTVKGK